MDVRVLAEVVEHCQRHLAGVDEHTGDRVRQSSGHGHLEPGGHAQSFGHRRTDTRQIGVEDVFEVGFQRGAQ